MTLLTVLLGVVFLYSAWSKLDTLQKFEYTLVEYLHFSWFIAAIGARLLIGMEAGLGLLLAFNLFGKNIWVLKLSTLSLLVFSIYLVFLWANEGNDVNCGCFGDKIAMTPLESLIKNAVMLLVLWVLSKYHTGLLPRKFNFAWIGVLCIMTILPLLLYALPDSQPEWLNKDKFQLRFTAIYEPGKKDAPTIKLDSGKYIISFFSLGCPHCRVAAYKMHLMKEDNPSLPFFMVLAGKEENKARFWEETKAQNIPYTTLEADSFTNLVGWRWPVIYWVNNGWVEAQANYITLSQNEIEEWLRKK